MPKKLFFVSGDGREFPEDKSVNQKFSIRASWNPIPDESGLEIILSDQEEAYTWLVQAWADKNNSST